MTVDAILHVVVAWFERVGAASLRLPSGWFGRPYDNLHRLTDGQVMADRLVIVLDGQMILTLTRPTAVVETNKSLIILGFDHGTWDWDEYGSGRSHVETFGDGEIEFVAL